MSGGKPLSKQDKEAMVLSSAKSGVPFILDLMDKWRSDEGVVSSCLAKLLSSPFDQVCAGPMLP